MMYVNKFTFIHLAHVSIQNNSLNVVIYLFMYFQLPFEFRFNFSLF